MPQVVSVAVINSGLEPIWSLMSTPARYPEFVGATEKMLDPGDGVFGVDPRWYLSIPMTAMWSMSLGKRTQEVIDASAQAANSIVEAEAGN